MVNYVIFEFFSMLIRKAFSKRELLCVHLNLVIYH